MGSSAVQRISTVVITALAAAASTPAVAVTVSDTYYEDQVEVNCSSASFCDAHFSLAAIPGKFLNLHFAACGGTPPGEVTTGSLRISDTASGSSSRRLQVLGLVGYTGPGTFSVRDQFEYKVAGGSPRYVHVQIAATTAGSWNMKCAITGEISTQ